MTRTIGMELDAALRAALVGTTSLVYVGPPAWWATLPVFEHLPRPPQRSLQTIVLVPDLAAADEGAAVLRVIAALQPVHAAAGLDRTARLLSTNVVTTLVLTPNDLLGLVGRAHISLATLARVVICWPEWLVAAGHADALDSILSEAAAAARVVFTADREPVADFLERHARRAPVQVTSSPPVEPAGSVQYALTAHDRLAATLCGALDALNPADAFVWDPVPGRDAEWRRLIPDPWVGIGEDPTGGPVGLAIATELPSAPVLAVLSERAKEVLVLVRPAQFPYLGRLVDRTRLLRITSEANRARDRQTRFRDAVRERIRAGVADAQYLALEPLFTEFDPALVAAALAAQAQPAEPAVARPAGLPAWVRIRISGGSRDRIRIGDVVGALLNAVGIAKRQVGRVDIRESFSLIEIEAEAAQQALAGLNGLVLRGKQLAARIDQR